MFTHQKLSCAYIPPSSSKEMGNQPQGNLQAQENSDSKFVSEDDSPLQSIDRSLDFELKDSGNDPAKILIVDNTPNNLQVLFSYLETAGFKVLLAENGESALQIARSQSPDLILLDVLMPDIDGFETCHRLKAQTATQGIPVIFLTALSETANKVRGFELGGVDYITKPIEREEVLARIQTHLNLQRMRRTLAIQNRELQQTLNFEASVRRITERIRNSLNESSCLQIATEELATVLNLGSCQIELYDADRVKATIVHEYSVTLPSCRGETRQVNDFPELYQQLLQQSPLQLVEAISLFNPSGIQVNRLACPIFDDLGIMGNLWGLRPSGEVFTSFEIRLMQQIAAQCAIAIRQARLYADSNRQVAEFAKLNQLKNDFLRTISHELKSPMSSIQLAAQTLENLLDNTKNSRMSPLFERVLKIFHDSCQRQKQLVDDLLTLCYVDAESKIIQPQLLNLNLWLEDLAQLYSDRIKSQQQKLILNLSPEQINLTIDPVILDRIVRELLNNACKYTPAEGTITIETRITRTEISLSVINSDVEISSEEQELIFNQFYRIPTNDPWKYGGTGLGLTLVRKLIEILDATINVESDRNRTVFCLKFPV